MIFIPVIWFVYALYSSTILSFINMSSEYFEISENIVLAKLETCTIWNKVKFLLLFRIKNVVITYDSVTLSYIMYTSRDFWNFEHFLPKFLYGNPSFSYSIRQCMNAHCLNGGRKRRRNERTTWKDNQNNQLIIRMFANKLWKFNVICSLS